MAKFLPAAAARAQALRDFATTRCVEMFNHNIMPPTHFQGNEFTGSFQEIVNTYGIPTYKEVNPAVFACVSFPFLFGVMFGDVGQGLVLAVVGVYGVTLVAALVAGAAAPAGEAPGWAVGFIRTLKH